MSADGDEYKGAFLIKGDLQASQVSSSFAIANTVSRSTFFHVNRMGKQQLPILVVTPDGEFHWDKDAESRLDLDDFEGYESLRHILLALWKDNKAGIKSEIVDY